MPADPPPPTSPQAAPPPPPVVPGPFTVPGDAAPPVTGVPTGPPGVVAPAAEGKAHQIGTLSMILALLLTAAIFTQVYAANTVAARAEVIDDLRLVNSLDQSLLDRVNEVNDEVGAAAAVSGLSWLVCGVAWMVWQRRFVRNASRFGPISPPLIWGTLGWFAPIASYFFPQSQLANAARQTDPHQLIGKSGMAPPVLYVWWVLFGAAHMTSLASRLAATDAATGVVRGGFSIGSYHDAIDNLERSDQFLTISFWVAAAAALAAAATVLVCTDRQRKLLAYLGVRS